MLVRTGVAFLFLPSTRNKILLSRAAAGIFRSCRKTKSRQQEKVSFCDGRLSFA
jgi:hypothetical protein